jgi:hypothetical protein
MLLNTFFFEKGFRGFHQTLKGVHDTKKATNLAVDYLRIEDVRKITTGIRSGDVS